MLKLLQRLFSSPTKKRAAIGTAALTGVLALTISATQVERPSQSVYPGTTTIAFPSCPATTVTLSGDQTAVLSQTSTNETWDLTGAVWNLNTPETLQYPIRSDAMTQGCIIGATTHGNIAHTGACSTRDEWWAGTGCTHWGSEVYRMTLTDTADNWVLIRDDDVENDEDLYDPNHVRDDSSMYLDHVHGDHGRDDCIENEGGGLPEQPGNVYINNSLFENCFVFMAARPPGSSTADNGLGNTEVKIENSLVEVAPSRLGSAFCDSSKVSLGRCVVDDDAWLGNYGVWKWSDAAPATVTVRDTIFKVEMPSYSSCQGQVWPDGTYENVTFVWAGTGDYFSAGSCTNTLPAGVTFTTDTSVWTDAVADWNAQ